MPSARAASSAARGSVRFPHDAPTAGRRRGFRWRRAGTAPPSRLRSSRRRGSARRDARRRSRFRHPRATSTCPGSRASRPRLPRRRSGSCGRPARGLRTGCSPRFRRASSARRPPRPPARRSAARARGTRGSVHAFRRSRCAGGARPRRTRARRCPRSRCPRCRFPRTGAASPSLAPWRRLLSCGAANRAPAPALPGSARGSAGRAEAWPPGSMP